MSQDTGFDEMAEEASAGSAAFEPQRLNQFFDPWLATSNPVIRGLADNVAFSFESAMPRRRSMKERDRENLAMIMQAIFANLACSVANGDEPPGVAVSLRSAKKKLSRYDRRGFFSLPKVLEELSDSDFGGVLRLHKSTKKGISSAIVPGTLFASFLNGSLPRLRPGQFYQQPGAELVVLSRTSRNHIEDLKAYEWIDYADTAESLRIRAEMEQINRFLSQADLTVSGAAPGAIPLRRRELRRFFKLPEGFEEPRFDLGGRLFGAWWQTIPKEARSRIRIEGQGVVELDYSSMFLRLAYLEAGLRPPPGDLYAAVDGPKIDVWREIVKTVASAMLFLSKPLTKMPKDAANGEVLPPGVTGKTVRSAILKAHPGLKEVFETGVGLELMFTESQVLVAVLQRLADLGIFALPIHDGLIVQQAVAWRVEGVMADAAKEIAGFALPVTQKKTPSL